MHPYWLQKIEESRKSAVITFWIVIFLVVVLPLMLVLNADAYLVIGAICFMIAGLRLYWIYQSESFNKSTDLNKLSRTDSRPVPTEPFPEDVERVSKGVPTTPFSDSQFQSDPAHRTANAPVPGQQSNHLLQAATNHPYSSSPNNVFQSPQVSGSYLGQEQASFPYPTQASKPVVKTNLTSAVVESVWQEYASDENAETPSGQAHRNRKSGHFHDMVGRPRRAENHHVEI